MTKNVFDMSKSVEFKGKIYARELDGPDFLELSSEEIRVVSSPTLIKQLNKLIPKSGEYDA